MTFSAVMTGVFITNVAVAYPAGRIGRSGGRGVVRLINGVVISKMKVPPFVATLGMLYVTKGLSLVISGLKPIYLTIRPLLPRFRWVGIRRGYSGV